MPQADALRLSRIDSLLRYGNFNLFVIHSSIVLATCGHAGSSIKLWAWPSKTTHSAPYFSAVALCSAKVKITSFSAAKTIIGVAVLFNLAKGKKQLRQRRRFPDQLPVQFLHIGRRCR
jgi:hypothetical protein